MIIIDKLRDERNARWSCSDETRKIKYRRVEDAICSCRPDAGPRQLAGAKATGWVD
jgi:hypothetical protein